MIKNLLRLIVLGIFNFGVLFLSDNSNVYQFYKDLNQIRVLESLMKTQFTLFQY